MKITIDDEENGYYLSEEHECVENIEDELRLERDCELELDLELEEHPDLLKKIMEEVAEEHTEEKLLKRELKDIAMERIEDGARNQEDFEYIIALWDKTDANRERKERYHEVGRGDVPLEYGNAEDPRIFPQYLCNEIQRNLRAGEFITSIFDCPFEIHQLVSNRKIAMALSMLKPEYKEIIHFHLVRKYGSKEIADIVGTCDRNIRSVYHTAVKRIRKNLLKLEFDSDRIKGLLSGEIEDEDIF